MIEQRGLMTNANAKELVKKGQQCLEKALDVVPQ
jgi:hypothetical protein